MKAMRLIKEVKYFSAFEEEGKIIAQSTTEFVNEKN